MFYKGRLLIAPPSVITDPFAQSVVLVYEETSIAATGIILNKSSNRSVQELAEFCNLKYRGRDSINIGGPINTSAIVMLHSSEWDCSNTLDVTPDLKVSSDHSMIERLCNGDKPRKWKLFFGMCTWTRRQLTQEITGSYPYTKKNSWLVSTATENIVFENKGQKMWDNAIKLAAQETTNSFF